MFGSFLIETCYRHYDLHGVGGVASKKKKCMHCMWGEGVAHNVCATGEVGPKNSIGLHTYFMEEPSW